MNRVWPALPLLVMGCGTGYGFHTDPDVTGSPNPRELENVRRTDRILQVNQPEVDVMWVVDSSCSMVNDKEAVIEHFPIFFDFFDGSGTDYHLGVITTDMSQAVRKGKLITAHGRRFIDPDTPNAHKVFFDMLPPIGGIDTQTGIATTYWALEHERYNYNLGFIREESSVHIILISDEQDSSQSQPVPSVEEVGAYLRGFRQDPDMITFSSIALPNSRYKDLTDIVGGIYRSINESNWGEVLEELGLQAAGLKREYYLSSLPVQGTIVVMVEEDGRTLAFDEKEDWEYDPIRNSIRFHSFVPKPYSEVIVEYTVLAEYHGD